ncbi:hypothetical protein [Moritella viscosa]|uniref:hypothetical protein n=1 Tax=Moritella viscosa TaxID=80854 RepID=UPI00094CA909|nr:hypothetical protein [Moritella viscosa]
MQIKHQPGNLSWEIVRGNPYVVLIEYIDSGLPVDLNVFTISGVIHTSCDTSLLTPIPINIIDSTAGQFEIDFNSEFTANLGVKTRTQLFNYSIIVTTPEGETFDLIKDIIQISG